MIIYFLEANKIYTFRLPVEVSGNYILSDYDGNGNKRSLVSVEARDGNWIIRDNDETKIIFNDDVVSETKLDLYNFYKLVVYGTERIALYVAPIFDTSFKSYSLNDGQVISIGSGNCDINYSLLSTKQIEIAYKNGAFYFKNVNPNVNVYINNSLKVGGNLYNFDTLFILGVRIVFLDNTIYINNPNELLFVQPNNFIADKKILICPNYQATADVYKDFYEEKDYFFKSPVFQNTLDKLELTISRPPEKNNLHRDPLILTVVPSAIMDFSSLLMGYFAFTNITKKNSDFQSEILTIVMCIGMLVAGVVWPFVERFYERFIDASIEKRRVKRYTKYLGTKEKVLIETVKNQKIILRGQHLSLSECRDAIFNKNPNLFSRNYESDSFLSIRLGVGSVPLYANIDFENSEYSDIDDNLVDSAASLIKNYSKLEDTPFALSLYDKNVLAFIGNNNLKDSYMNAILLQILAYHSYFDLKIVVLTDNSCPGSLRYLKESNYCFSDDKKTRFFATNFDEGQIISDFLEKEFAIRHRDDDMSNSNVKSKKYLPYYLILSDSISLYKNLEIVTSVLEQKNNAGFGLIMFDNKVVNVPEGCKNFVNYTFEEGNYFTSSMAANDLQKFTPEFITGDINILSCISKLSDIPLKSQNTEALYLPDNLGFLEMYGVGKVEQLNVFQKWSTSNIVNSLAAPIGVDANGNTLSLDLHEKKHGPHGLIAGMTGSGKSEFIITYILSLSVNYSPSEVQFVLIDYKGGGLAGAFENRKTGVKLPHLVGTITNLDKAEMKRTLVSINSELHRRQRIFNEAKEKLNTGTIDIYKYQRLVRDGKLEQPLSHLFIICDEFAELKAQQPEFMDELVSTARIGRSLGVHLILATQKPSGVVDDQIWSNSKFKVCCKVQTAEDSTEMLKRPDAAFIKEAGRFYLQVGYDEYFAKGQSAYSGRTYYPSEKIKSTISTDIDFINNMGDVIKTYSSDEALKVESNMGEELINVLDYIIKVAKDNGYKNQQLWLDNVPKKLLFDDLRKKYQPKVAPFDISPLIGEYDDPENQLQGPVNLDITKKGNVFVTGVSGSGKSTLLSTIVYSTIISHMAEEVNFYIMDFSTESLTKFATAPQVGEVLTINDNMKVEKLFYYLQKIIEKRKRHYSTKGGSFEFDVSNGKSIFPNIIVIINGIDLFREQFETLYDELFCPMTRDCFKFGINFIVTGTTTNSLGYAAENNFGTAVAMKLADPTDYVIFFNKTSIIPNENPGRGLIQLDNVYEFQTSLIFDYDVLDSNLNYVITQLNKITKTRAPKLPVLPSLVTLSSFKNETISLSSLPIGYEIKSSCPYFYNFNNFINLITFKKDKSIISFIPALVNCFSYLNGMKNIVLSSYEFFTMESSENIKFYGNNFKSITSALKDNFSKIMQTGESDNSYMITIFGYTKLNAYLTKEKKEDDSIVTLDELVVLCNGSKHIKFVVVDSCDIMKTIDDFAWFNLTSTNNGILVAGTTDDQELFIVKDDYSNSMVNRDEAIVIENGVKKYIKFVNK